MGSALLPLGWMGRLSLADVGSCPVYTGKVKKELDPDDSHLNLDETAKLLQDLHEAQAERGGSRPSSNLSSLSNASERDQHHLGETPPPTPHPQRPQHGQCDV